ncbi:hypothetical protein L218DRAFT_863567 [Marasmius fiardii PR-910]|nr:hypothetical protein L218DRAFT_863567 [Marasmius fiardii PR-910]
MLHSEYFLSGAEIIRNKAILEDEEEALRQYDEEITRLQSTLGKLRTERDALHRRVVERRWAVSALRRFPNEILSEIFCLCVGDQPSLSVGPDEYSSTIPLDISHTCSRWRNVIKALPQLWSSIHIEAISNPSSICILTGLGITI